MTKKILLGGLAALAFASASATTVSTASAVSPKYENRAPGIKAKRPTMNHLCRVVKIIRADGTIHLVRICRSR